HPDFRSFFHVLFDFAELLGMSDALLDAARHQQSLDRREAAGAILAEQEPEAHDRHQVLCQAGPHHRLIFQRKEADQPSDSTLGMGRMDLRYPEMPCLGGLKRYSDRVATAALSDEYDIGVLPHCRAQPRLERVGVGANLTLGDNR